MSTGHIQQPADDGAWLPRVTDALHAVRSLYRAVSRQNGNTARLARQMRCLQQARAAWLAGDRGRARQLLAAALEPDDGPPPAGGAAPDPASRNGQAGEDSTAGPAAPDAAPGRKEPEASQIALG